jgi:hypothetical protein
MNNENGPLRYLSMCSPGFTKKQCQELWPLLSIENLD